MNGSMFAICAGKKITAWAEPMRPPFCVDEMGAYPRNRCLPLKAAMAALPMLSTT
jgi:hypothetical protein